MAFSHLNIRYAIRTTKNWDNNRGLQYFAEQFTGLSNLTVNDLGPFDVKEHIEFAYSVLKAFPQFTEVYKFTKYIPPGPERLNPWNGYVLPTDKPGYFFTSAGLEVRDGEILIDIEGLWADILKSEAEERKNKAEAKEAGIVRGMEKRKATLAVKKAQKAQEALENKAAKDTGEKAVEQIPRRLRTGKIF